MSLFARGTIHIAALDVASPEEDVDPVDGTILTALCGATFEWRPTRGDWCKDCVDAHLAESDEWRQSHNALVEAAEAVLRANAEVERARSEIAYQRGQIATLRREIGEQTEKRHHLEAVGYSPYVFGQAVGEIYHLRAILARTASALQTAMEMKTFPRTQRPIFEMLSMHMVNAAVGDYAGDSGYQKAIAAGLDLDLQKVLVEVGASPLLTNHAWLEQAGLDRKGDADD